MAIKKCWMVTGPAGDSVFLEKHRAEAAIVKYGGVLVNMYGQTHYPGTGGGQAGESAESGTEQLYQNPSSTVEVRNPSRATH